MSNELKLDKAELSIKRIHVQVLKEYYRTKQRHIIKELRDEYFLFIEKTNKRTLESVPCLIDKQSADQFLFERCLTGFWKSCFWCDFTSPRAFAVSGRFCCGCC